MRILHWPYGKKKRKKKQKRKLEREKQEERGRMPNFRRLFESMENVIDAGIAEPKDEEKPDFVSAQDRAAEKSVADKDTRAAASKSKVDDVYARIQTVRSKDLEVVWLLQTDKDIACESLSELIENYGNVKESDSCKGMSVNYVQKGKLHEISPLNEQDLDCLAEKLECQK